jgi:ribonuclease VapC
VILDTSAIVAILLKEPGWEGLFEKVAGAESAAVGGTTLAEAAIVLSAKMGRSGRTTLSAFVREADLTVVPFGEAHWQAAADAYWQFGKGRHGAALNLGDCMSYAVARLSAQPLLCTGRDFGRTDLPLA